MSAVDKYFFVLENAPDTIEVDHDACVGMKNFFDKLITTLYPVQFMVDPIGSTLSVLQLNQKMEEHYKPEGN